MPFKKDIIQMQNRTSNPVDKTKYANQYVPDPQYPNLILRYPGKLNKHGDYKMEFYGTPLTHPDIVRTVHQFALNGPNHAQFITNFLVGIFLNGLKAVHNSNQKIIVKNRTIDLDEFKHLVYWIVLQEDINFPRPLKKGIRMPFWRYIEGVMAAEHPSLITLYEVIQRTNNHGAPPPPPFTHENLQPYLINSIRKI